jgi:hypothetical protein
VLILLTVTGGLAVGVGIIWEAQRGGHLWTLPTLFVFFGVVIEAAATVILFEFDEGISHAQQALIDSQQSTIISLEKAAAPRNIEVTAAMVEKLSKFNGTEYDLTMPVMLEPGSVLINQLLALLTRSGWKIRSIQETSVPSSIMRMTLMTRIFATDEKLSFEQREIVAMGSPVFVGVSQGIVGVLIGVRSPKIWDPAAALMFELRDAGITAEPQMVEPADGVNPDVIHITIGTK